MNVIPFDPITLALLWAGCVLVMIPLLVLAVRFAVIPLLETLIRLRTPATAGPVDPEIALRLSRAEARIARMSAEIERLNRAAGAHAA